jgi:ubiquinone/menaquinone biosynthesis C-methylase UbiE
MQDLLTHDLKIDKSQHSRASERFVASLRAYVLVDMADQMRSDYEQNVAPEIAGELGTAADGGVVVHKAMRKRPMFQLYSSMRCAAQEMVWRTGLSVVNPANEELTARAATIAADQQRAQGSLQLGDAVQKPDYYDKVDVHLMPGNYDAHGQEVGVAPGALYDNSFNVFAFGVMGKEFSDIGWSFANFLRLRHPDFTPGVVVDVGCTIGHNTLPWKQTFPDAEVHGVDLSAGCLKYGHARAQAMGVTAHFHQGSGNALPFEDSSVDVVFSSMFLHELPNKQIRAFLAEAHRVLKPGGMLLNMELPPNSALQPYDAFYLDWDCYYNNEPYYKNFRDQDYQELCTTAGFSADEFFQAVMPRYTYVDEDKFKARINSDAVFNDDTGRLSDEIEWYGFGARKAS